MRTLCAMIFLVLASAAHAEPRRIQPGELYGHRGGWTGNAYTAKQGTVNLHPLLRSSIGVTDFMDLKVSFLGLVFGPAVSAEFAVVDTGTVAVSVEPRLASSWTASRLDLGTAARVTFGSPKKGLFTTGLLVAHCSGCGLDTNNDGIPDTAVKQGVYDLRPEVTYEFVLTKKSHLVVTGRTNIIQLSRGRAVFWPRSCGMDSA